jgi:hypothetical protein
MDSGLSSVYRALPTRSSPAPKQIFVRPSRPKARDSGHCDGHPPRALARNRLPKSCCRASVLPRRPKPCHVVAFRPSLCNEVPSTRYHGSLPDEPWPGTACPSPKPGMPQSHSRPTQVPLQKKTSSAQGNGFRPVLGVSCIVNVPATRQQNQTRSPKLAEDIKQCSHETVRSRPSLRCSLMLPLSVGASGAFWRPPEVPHSHENITHRDPIARRAAPGLQLHTISEHSPKPNRHRIS